MACRESIGNKKINVDEVLNYIHSINKDNCKTKSPEDLQLKVSILKGLFTEFSRGIYGTVFRSGIRISLKNSNFSIKVVATVDFAVSQRGPNLFFACASPNLKSFFCYFHKGSLIFF